MLFGLLKTRAERATEQHRARLRGLILSVVQEAPEPIDMFWIFRGVKATHPLEYQPLEVGAMIRQMWVDGELAQAPPGKYMAARI